MHVILIGCGRVGSSLAGELDAAGHHVVIVDEDPKAFRRLPASFRGTTVQGLAFDRSTLLKAGVDHADAFVTVTSGDNSNIVAARIARERFGVRTVVARIYDPDRATIYERHGITTIASARWTTDAILGHLREGVLEHETAIGPGEGDVVVLAHDLPAEGGPWEVERFQRQGKWLLAAVTRVGQTSIPVPRQLLQAGERIHLAVQRSALEEAEAFLSTVSEESQS
ncbi:potassium channel family protein [Euzebya rosea]|uniref:potassium channel family protein n=1 Tax=Euzebya rosea TaxID=2052804 RepID=UPI001473899D|nr:TrkA family potassium uptake protein [Euzebya rosea]